MNTMVKNLLLWLVIAAVLLSVFNNFNMQGTTEQVGYSELISEIQTDQVKKVVVDGLTITGERYDGTRFETIRPMVEDPKLIDDLLEHNVEVEGRKPEQQSVWTQLLVASFPILIIIAVFMFFMRQMQGGGGGRGGPGGRDREEGEHQQPGRRRRAEEALLRLLLAEPTFATTPVDLGGDSSTPLDRFAEIEPRKAEVVKLRYFIGMTIEETAEALGISTPTAKRDWIFARAWLFRELKREE